MAIVFMGVFPVLYRYIWSITLIRVRHITIVRGKNMREILNNYGILLENVNLKDYTTYQIGGIARYVVKPVSVENFVSLVDFLNTNNHPYFILGNGSNVILPDEDFDGIIIRLDSMSLFEVNLETAEVYVEAGVYIPRLANQALKHGLSGLEWAGGLPGSIGASILNNAGAYNVEMQDIIKEVIVYKNKTIERIKREDIHFAYRSSEFKENRDAIILAAVLQLEKQTETEIKDVMQKRAKKRLETQPVEYPSAGSVFRNPDKELIEEQMQKYNLCCNSSGYLIEQAGLKGHEIGGAKVSEKHANFIVNFDNATSKDVTSLIQLIQDTIKEKFEIDLILEQEIVKWN